MQSLQHLSCTDLECSWATKKKDVQRSYAPLPLHTFCHVKRDDSAPVVSADQLKEMGEQLRKAAPDSAVEAHR